MKPHALELIIEQLNNSGEVSFCVDTDTCNHGSVKMYPICARYTRNDLNAYVTFSREPKAVRNKIILSAKKFLLEKLNIEDSSEFKNMKNMLETDSSKEFIEKGMSLARISLKENELSLFAEQVCEQWPLFKDAPTLSSSTDLGTRYSTRLRNLLKLSKGTVRRVLSTIFVTSPHIMTTERAVSHCNQLMTCHRQSTSNAHINYRLAISLNGRGTAAFDPRPSVVRFLKSKERRYHEPCAQTYEKRNFVAKFFRSNSSF